MLDLLESVLASIRPLLLRNLEETPVTALATTLIEKLQQLPAGRLVEVEDFVDFLHSRERQGGISG